MSNIRSLCSGFLIYEKFCCKDQATFGNRQDVSTRRDTQQLRIGQVPIHDLEINLKDRDSYVHFIRALKEVFTVPEYSTKIFSVLEDKILSGKKATGLPGMDLLQIFVLSVVRLGLNIGYDRLHIMANNDRMLRTLIGIVPEIGFKKN